MSIEFTIWLIIGAISIAYYFVSNAKKGAETEETEKSEYAAVSIVYNKSKACPAVMKYGGQRLLTEEAPRLPLPDCTKEVCTCSYHHSFDRRDGPRRADEQGAMKRGYAGAEHRKKTRGRRAEDDPKNIDKLGSDLDHDPMADTYYEFIEKTGVWKAPAKK